MYEVRAKTDIVTPDGTVRLRAGELADTLVTETEKDVYKRQCLYWAIYTKFLRTILGQNVLRSS